MPIRLHVDDPDRLAQAILLTARRTGFAPRLVEKDYFCSVVLEFLAGAGPDLAFRGGTCFTKVHSGFYRLSEELDFACSIDSRASRGARSERARAIKARFADAPRRLEGMQILEGLSGSNQSVQYNGVLGYTSLFDRDPQPVRVVGWRR